MEAERIPLVREYWYVRTESRRNLKKLSISEKICLEMKGAMNARLRETQETQGKWEESPTHNTQLRPNTRLLAMHTNFLSILILMLST